MKLIKLFLCVNIYLVKITEVLNLLSDLNQAEVLSGLKEIIEKQNDENMKLQNKYDILKIENEKLADKNVKLLNKNEMLEKEYRLKNSK